MINRSLASALALASIAVVAACGGGSAPSAPLAAAPTTERNDGRRGTAERNAWHSLDFHSEFRRRRALAEASEVRLAGGKVGNADDQRQHRELRRQRVIRELHAGNRGAQLQPARQRTVDDDDCNGGR